MPDPLTGKVSRGAYVARLDLAAPHLSGVAKKIAAQAEAMGAALGPMTVYSLRGRSLIADGRPVRRFVLPPRLALVFSFYGALAPLCANGDYVYIRYQRITPVFLWMLWRLRRMRPDIPVFLEVPTYPPDPELSCPRQRVLGWIDRRLRPMLPSLIDRIVTFADQSEIWGIATIRIENGVGLEHLPVSQPAACSPIRLVGVANLARRHAYDRVIDGLADYRADGHPDAAVFDIIGSGRERAALEARAKARGVLDLVQFHGPLSGAALDARMAQAHIGVSGLGMHRIGADTTDIKSREYCARGMPFVIANTDRDFGADFPYAFHAPQTEAPIDIAALLAFHDRLRRDRPDYPRQMRRHAETHLSWQAKMRPVIDTLSRAADPARMCPPETRSQWI